MSTINVRKYLENALIGFNKKNDELLVTNDIYNYSYVYNFESGYWHKIDKSFSILIETYPSLEVMQTDSEDGGIFDLSNEIDAISVNCLLVTRPCKIDDAVDFVLIHRAIQRCEITTPASSFAGFYVFGSNDLKVWQMLQGSDTKTGDITDILLTRSHLKVKYFVFVFASQLKEGSAIINKTCYFKFILSNKFKWIKQ